MNIIKQRHLEAIENMNNNWHEDKNNFVEAAEACSVITEQEMEKLLTWLTDEDCPYSIMYGGTPELEKDYRFAGNIDKDYTIKEVIEIYKTQTI